MPRLILLAIWLASNAAFGAERFESGKIVRFDAPLSAMAKQWAKVGGNPPIERAACAVVLPEKFTPARSWPILVVNTPIGTSAVEAIAQYSPTASAAGWVTLAADGGVPAKLETTEWCHAMLFAAFEQLAKSWPGVDHWPVACAGFSGGAKRAPYIGAVLLEDEHPLLGLFLGGCNEDRVSDALRWHKPGSAFLRTPIFLSHGREDSLATADETTSVVESMQRSGFQNVRAEPYDGGHELNAKELMRALEWFHR
jgi:hypothetical protein